MSQTSDNNKRIAKNTLLLYFRMIFMMIVGLYTSRVILNALGVEDFGIYNVIGGLVGMFAIVSSSLTTAISRFITVSLGKGEKLRLNQVFSTSLIVQSIIALSVIILAESLGVWFLNNKMIIPDIRMAAANWVFQCSIFSFAIGLISVPYNASIIAHEKMSAFAYISILEASLKLFVAFMLSWGGYDKLIVYAILLLVVSIIIRFTYSIYCSEKFSECRFHFVWDKLLLKEMAGFAGWSFIGNTAGILRNQGGNILMNIYGGPIINAAAGIANQVNNAITGFSNNFIMAVNPQIIKLYSQDKLAKSYSLVLNSARLSFMLMLLITTPLIVATPQILHLWLKLVPDYSVNFVRLILILSLIECTCIPLVTLNQATGKIRNYQLVVGSIHLLNFPLAWLLLLLGNRPEVVYVVAILLAVINLYARLIMLHRMLGISIWQFNKNVVLRAIFASALVYGITLLYLQISNTNIVLKIATSLFIAIAMISLVGTNRNERSFVLKKLKLSR